MKDVHEICDRVLFMHHGRIIANGTPDDLLKQFQRNTLDEVFIAVARSGDLNVGDEE
jgi:ABC-2 type transport system ATP-binding protein